MRLIERLEKSREFWFLLALSLVFFLLRLPSLFEPYWYGDEGIYQAIGITLRDGGTLYQDAFDNKPPLLYVIYAIFNSEQYLVRAASLVFGVASVWAYLLLAKLLFPKNSRWILYFTTALFAVLFGLPLLEGNIANAENFMLFPIISSAILIFTSLSQTQEDKRNLTLFFAGAILSFAFLIKIVAVFDFLSFFTFLIIFNLIKYKEVKLKKIYFLLVGFFTPALLTSLYFLFTANFKNFLNASLFSNINYVGFGNSIFFPQDFLFAKALLVFLFVYILYRKRNSLNTSSLFILIWLAFSVFNAFFSQRPYIHYLLVILPTFCLLIGLLFWERKLQKILSILFIFLLLIILSNFKLYAKTDRYYSNFLDFLLGKKSTIEYIGFFDRRAVTDYKIASFINSKAEVSDTIYVWGNNAQLYKMTDKIPLHRYTVLYHVTNYKDGYALTVHALDSEKPRFIVVMQEKQLLPISLYNYTERMKTENATIYERVN